MINSIQFRYGILYAIDFLTFFIYMSLVLMCIYILNLSLSYNILNIQNPPARY